MDWIRYLAEQQIIDSDEAEAEQLAGGVSSRVILVRTPTKSCVVKQALAKLQVQDDWYCNPARSANECRAIRYVEPILPGAVPKILHVDPQLHLYVMEYFDARYRTWKEWLLSGTISPSVAAEAGRLLGTLHSATHGSEDARQQFDTTADFYDLRIEPYLLTAATRNPPVAHLLRYEGERLRTTRSALVHGDYSAKNLLVSRERMVILDWEVAWYGDPAFDVAFLLNLLYLKSAYLVSCREALMQAIDEFLSAYGQANSADPAMRARVCPLTMMLMLARLDGKSPAEYLVGPQHAATRDRVRRRLIQGLLDHITSFADWNDCWRTEFVSHEM